MVAFTVVGLTLNGLSISVPGIPSRGGEVTIDSPREGAEVPSSVVVAGRVTLPTEDTGYYRLVLQDEGADTYPHTEDHSAAGRPVGRVRDVRAGMERKSREDPCGAREWSRGLQAGAIEDGRGWNTAEGFAERRDKERSRSTAITLCVRQGAAQRHRAPISGHAPQQEDGVSRIGVLLPRRTRI